MPKKLQVDAAKLVAEVESQKPSKEIMAEFGIKTLIQLKALYVDALAELGRTPTIISSRGAGSSAPVNSKELRVNKRGSLVVPRELVDEMGFEVGQTFQVRKTAAGVSLKKMS